MEDFLLGICLLFIEHLGLQSSAWVGVGWGDQGEEFQEVEDLESFRSLMGLEFTGRVPGACC